MQYTIFAGKCILYDNVLGLVLIASRPLRLMSLTPSLLPWSETWSPAPLCKLCMGVCV